MSTPELHTTGDGTLSSFKAYDVRGRVPDELNEELALAIGKAYAHLVEPGRVAVGRDMRLSGEGIMDAVVCGLTEAGADVVDIGRVGTEQVYFATFALGLDGGIMVTASHNPADYNGMKFVRRGAVPISADSGLIEMEEMVRKGLQGEGPLASPRVSATPGTRESVDIMDQYVAHLLSYVNMSSLKPLSVVANGGNGMAGPVVEKLSEYLPFTFEYVDCRPDGTFPNGVPNPLLPENRAATAEAVRKAGADIGLAWDGDFDRCFFFDENGDFVEGYYVVGLLAAQALRMYPGEKIIHDPRLTWSTIDMVEQTGGIPVMNKSGHAFIKDRMRREDAVYGGEVSAHHYFRDFSYCDSGMIPWLFLAELASEADGPLSSLVAERRAAYPISGEINLELTAPSEAIAAFRKEYAARGAAIDETDGVSVEFDSWRANVRPSNTEPVVRVNVEARGDRELLQEKTEEILAFLERSG